MSQRRVEEAQVVSHMHVFDDEVVHHDEGQHLTALRSEVSRPGPWRARGKACGLRCDGEDPTLFAQPGPPRNTPYRYLHFILARGSEVLKVSADTDRRYRRYGQLGVPAGFRGARLH